MTNDVRRRYRTDQILTASPERLVTLMYDALVTSLTRASASMPAGRHHETHEALVRAQGIVLELQHSLKPELWDGGPQLLAVYHYIYRRLVHANISKDVTAVVECLALVEPLQRAWHDAAAQLAGERLSAERAALAV